MGDLEFGDSASDTAPKAQPVKEKTDFMKIRNNSCVLQRHCQGDDKTKHRLRENHFSTHI